MKLNVSGELDKVTFTSEAETSLMPFHFQITFTWRYKEATLRTARLNKNNLIYSLILLIKGEYLPPANRFPCGVPG